MYAQANLLEQARQLMRAGQFHNAELVLDALIRVDPQNVAAWKEYLLVRRDQAGLDWAKDRALKTQELGEAGQCAIIELYLHLSERMHAQPVVKLEQGAFEPSPCRAENSAGVGDVVRFELLEVFDYSTEPIGKFPRARTRRIRYRFTASALRAALHKAFRSALWQAAKTHGSQAVRRAKALLKEPERVFYARLIDSPQFETVSGFILLTLLALGIRLVSAGTQSGFIVLGAAIIGGGWWFSAFQSQPIAMFREEVRTYLQESENPPAVVERKEEMLRGVKSRRPRKK